MTTLDELKALIGPPSRSAPPVDWTHVESAEGLVFPTDYKLFAGSYAPLIIDNFIHVAHPSTPGDGERALNRQLRRDLDALRELRQSHPNEVRYPLYPEPDGLYPWGGTDNGDSLFWLTQGDPDHWPVIGTSRSGWAEYQGTMTEFLVAVLGRQHKFELFPDDFPSSKITIYEYD